MATLITLSGIDCAGKSTQIALLRRALEVRGGRVEVLWLRPGYSPLLDAVRRWIRRLRPGAIPAPTDVRSRERVFSDRRVQRAWILMAVLDMMVHYAVLLRLKRLVGRSVICDRYVDDALMDLELRFPQAAVRQRPDVRLLRWLAPRPQVALLLSISEEEMLRRAAVKNEPFPDAPQVRSSRHAAYQRLAREGRFTVVDAGRRPEETHAEILSALDRTGARA